MLVTPCRSSTAAQRTYPATCRNGMSAWHQRVQVHAVAVPVPPDWITIVTIPGTRRILVRVSKAKTSIADSGTMAGPAAWEWVSRVPQHGTVEYRLYATRASGRIQLSHVEATYGSKRGPNSTELRLDYDYER